jgi:uncharacterized membrane protein
MDEKWKYLLIVLAALVVLWIVAPAWGRAVTGFVFALFVPGFALVYMLFPQKEIDEIETLALSFGLSICVVVLDGVLIDKLWEISLIPVVVSLLLFSVVCFLVGVVWRVRTNRL